MRGLFGAAAATATLFALLLPATNARSASKRSTCSNVPTTFARKVECGSNHLCQGASDEQGYGTITVNGVSTGHAATGISITSNMIMYIGTAGIEVKPKEAPCNANGLAFSPPFCSGVNTDDVDSSCGCWCPQSHGRLNGTGPCVPAAKLPVLQPATSTRLPEMAVDNGDKTNVGGDDDGGGERNGTGGGGNDGDADDEQPPEKSSTAIAIGVLVPLLLLAGGVGYMLALRKKGQGQQRSFTQSRGPPTRPNPAFSVDDADAASASGIYGDDAYGQLETKHGHAVRQPSDDEANHDMPDGLTPGGGPNAYEAPVLVVDQNDGNYDMPVAGSAAAPQSRTTANATYDTASGVGDSSVTSPNQYDSVDQDASYSLASATGQDVPEDGANYSLASASPTQQAYSLADDAGIEL